MAFILRGNRPRWISSKRLKKKKTTDAQDMKDAIFRIRYVFPKDVLARIGEKKILQLFFRIDPWVSIID